jgi:putative FmdB family regulatory protein
MPTYEYECLEEGHRFEEFQSISEAPIEVCPVCGGRARRLISGGAGILFKGSGFYQTDYRSESYRKAEKAEKAPASSGGGSDSSRTPSSGSDD